MVAFGSALVGIAVAAWRIVDRCGKTRPCARYAWHDRRHPSIAAFVALSLAPVTGGLARAQTLEVSPGGAIGLGNRGWSASEPNRATSANELEFSARVGAASDYIYRGTTLSDHGPAAGAAFEARYGLLYAGTTVATVKLPTQPFAEFTFATGIRPKIATIDFDFGVTYFAYPGERLPGETGIDLARHRALARRLDPPVAIHYGELVAPLDKGTPRSAAGNAVMNFSVELASRSAAGAGAMFAPTGWSVPPTCLVGAATARTLPADRFEPLLPMQSQPNLRARWEQPTARRPIAAPTNIGSEVCFHRDSDSPRGLPQPDLSAAAALKPG